MNRFRALLCVVGAGLTSCGAWGLCTAERGPDPVSYLGFVAAGVLGHDLVLAPVALAVGAVVAGTVPRWARRPVLVGLFVSLTVTLLALPFVLRYGTRPDDPSALPLDYGHGLLLVLGALWAGVAVVILVRAVPRPRHRDSA